MALVNTFTKHTVSAPHSIVYLFILLTRTPDPSVVELCACTTIHGLPLALPCRRSGEVDCRAEMHSIRRSNVKLSIIILFLGEHYVCQKVQPFMGARAQLILIWGLILGRWFVNESGILCWTFLLNSKANNSSRILWRKRFYAYIYLIFFSGLVCQT